MDTINTLGHNVLSQCTGFKEHKENTTGTDFIRDNYEKLINYCCKFTKDMNNACCVMSNVFIGISYRQETGEWKVDRDEAGAVVYTFIKNYAKNPKYLNNEYDNKDKLKGEISVIKLSNHMEAGESVYHDIFEAISTVNNFENKIENRMDYKELINDLRTSDRITTLGRNLINITLSKKDSLIEEIDMSIYELLNSYEKRLLYNILKLRIKLIREGEKEYVQHRGA